MGQIACYIPFNTHFQITKIDFLFRMQMIWRVNCCIYVHEILHLDDITFNEVPESLGNYMFDSIHVPT